MRKSGDDTFNEPKEQIADVGKKLEGSVQMGEARVDAVIQDNRDKVKGIEEEIIRTKEGVMSQEEEINKEMENCYREHGRLEKDRNRKFATIETWEEDVRVDSRVWGYE